MDVTDNNHSIITTKFCYSGGPTEMCINRDLLGVRRKRSKVLKVLTAVFCRWRSIKQADVQVQSVFQLEPTCMLFCGQSDREIVITCLASGLGSNMSMSRPDRLYQ